MNSLFITENSEDLICDKESKKYHYITFRKDKPVKHEIFDKKQVIKTKEPVIYIKLRTLNKDYYYKEKKSPFKTTGGPLFAEINIYKMLINFGCYMTKIESSLDC